MENNINNPNKTVFEQIKRLDENKNEYWTARDLSRVLEYSEFRHFKPVIERAKEACKNSGLQVSDHYEDILGMVSIGSGAEREIDDVKLSRYACYLIVQNADPSKEIDLMVYKLYELTYEEVKVVDKDFWLTETEYNNFINF